MLPFKDSERSIFGRLWLILLCRVLISVGYSIAFPYFAVYLSRDRAFDLRLIGLVMGLSLVVSAIAQILGGLAADRLGRRRVMMGGMAARSLCILAMAISIEARAGLSTLMALHWLGSFAAGFFDSAADAWTADWFDEKARLKAFSWIRTGGNLGWALGPVLGGLGMGKGYAGLFFWTAGIYAGCLVLLRTWLDESPHHPRRDLPAAQMLAHFLDRKLLILGLGTLLIGTVMSQLITPLSIYAVDFMGMSAAKLGFLFSINGAVVVLFQIPLAHWGQGKKLSVFLWGGSIFYALGYGYLSLAAGFGFAAAAVAGVTLGEIAVSPAMNAVAANLAGEETKGAYLGFVRFARQMGWAIGPVIGGWGLAFWGRLRPCPYWMLIGACALAAAVVYRSLGLRLSAREEGQLI
ncbi:MAG: MFS transporter [Elusimicrobiota bacterium]